MRSKNAWRAERERWEREVVLPFLDRIPERRERFETASGETLERVFTPEHVESDEGGAGFPGEYPFLRGPYPTMYRTQPWTIRQYADEIWHAPPASPSIISPAWITWATR